MTEPKTYEIRTVDDLLAVPDERLEACLIDLAAYVRIVRTSVQLGEDVARLLDIPGLCGPGRFVWIDDGMHEARLQFHHEGEVVAEGIVDVAPPEEPR